MNKIYKGIIYKITNKKNGKFYIGSTIDKSRRWEDHKRMLKNNCHNNPHLQNTWNKYSNNDFEFSIIEKVQDKNNLLDREDFYIKYINYYTPKKLYNIARDAKAPFQGRKHSKETKVKMSEATSGEDHPMYGKHHSEKAKEKMSKSSSGKNNPNYGKHHSEETKRKISEAQKGKKLSEEHRQKLSEAKKGENHPMYGKHHSKETKQKISKAEKGEKNHNYGKEFSEKHKRRISENHANFSGENHPNAELTAKKVKVILHLSKGNSFTHKEIGKMYGVSGSTISSVVTGKSWPHISKSQPSE